MRTTVWLLLSLCGMVCTADSQIQPQRPQVSEHRSAGPSDVEARLAALERRMSELESRVSAALHDTSGAAANTAGDASFEALEKKVELLEAKKAAGEPARVSAGRDTFSIRSANDEFRLRFGGHLQADGRAFLNSSSSSAFTLRRLRPILEGSLGRRIEFRFAPDFGNGKAMVYDAYVDLKASPFAVVRAGKFKTPIGLEALQNDAELSFLERALPSALLPNRDEGVQLSGTVEGRLSYTVAVLNGAPDGGNLDGDPGNHKDLVGRLFATPFVGSHALRGWGFGVGAGGGRQDRVPLPALATSTGQTPFFSYASNAVALGGRVHVSPQMYYYKGPFGLLGEYVASRQQVSAPAGSGTVTRRITNRAWQVAGSWVVTGENKSYRGVAPRSDGQGRRIPGRGAWELVARYSELNVDPAAFSSQLADLAKSARTARSWTMGVNWYMNYFTKLQLDYEETHFERGAAAGNRPVERLFAPRLQIYF